MSTESDDVGASPDGLRTSASFFANKPLAPPLRDTRGRVRTASRAVTRRGALLTTAATGVWTGVSSALGFTLDDARAAPAVSVAAVDFDKVFSTSAGGGGDGFAATDAAAVAGVGVTEASAGAWASSVDASAATALGADTTDFSDASRAVGVVLSSRTAIRGGAALACSSLSSLLSSAGGGEYESACTSRHSRSWRGTHRLPRDPRGESP